MSQNAGLHAREPQVQLSFQKNGRLSESTCMETQHHESSVLNLMDCCHESRTVNKTVAPAPARLCEVASTVSRRLQ